ncbi:uncharacterized protein ARB_01318 [Trichophyton benhamiae CBS 112371]|uniref:Uncharacterized protein n=1 Tax=Arthroderma benhamiae (strain ATCC MYA-4681 / CBS 112371) TaxID=663331 RepID=D4AYP9_ARTBC|nr:uncharacterized protein ARB_01318 [Trichophyton benhamiae CBS 112371]EFE31719.1 hypothetical protein ARB_01318 [Trichophyton benhamiae CBS 112371]
MDGDLRSWPCGRRQRKEEKEREERQEEEREREREASPPPPLHLHALAQRGHDMWESSGRAYVHTSGTPDVSHLVSSMPQDARRKQLAGNKVKQEIKNKIK